MDKRKLLKGIGASSLWVTPTVATILTPAHAQATASACTGTFAPETFSFDSPGEFSVVVPNCATRMSVEVAGGSSGSALDLLGRDTSPGTGSFVTSTVNVTGGETLSVIVAERGQDSILSNPTPIETGATIGYGRGGNGGIQERLGLQGGGYRMAAGGGGGSAILRGSEPLAVAGGGGGVWVNTVGTDGDTNAALGGATAGSNGQGGVGGTTLATRPGFENTPNGDQGGMRDGGNGSVGLILPPFAVNPGGGGGGGFGGGGGGGADDQTGRQGAGGGSMFTGNGSVVPGGAPAGNGSVVITFE